MRRTGIHTSVFFLAYGVTIGPITEEIFFRGFLYNAVVRRFAPVIAMCLQAFLFAMTHPYGRCRLLSFSLSALSWRAFTNGEEHLLLPSSSMRSTTL